MSDTLRIVRFTAADCGGHWLAFSSADEATFYATVDAIKRLGAAHAMWTPSERAWWLSSNGLARLCGRDPALAWLLGEYRRTGGASSDGPSSGGTSGGGKRKRASSAGGQRKTSGAKSAKAARVPADVQQALACLYLRDDAPVAVVKAVYRALAKAGAHPDLGGDHEQMKRLNASYELVEAWATTHGARLAATA